MVETMNAKLPRLIMFKNRVEDEFKIFKNNI